jgi:putative ABC transport system permease protein
VIINESMAAQLGFSPEDAVGKPVPGYKIRLPDTDEASESLFPTIVGVIADINYKSLHVGVESMMMTMDPSSSIRYALVRVSNNDLSNVIKAVGESWAGFAPDIPLSYSFLDDDLAQTYRNDQRWSSVVRYSAGIAILIACMGLFGLAALTIARRTKEIGVRKVLGASITSLLVLVTGDFARLVGLATLIGAPVAYVALNRWLEGFAYHVELSAWVFLFAGFSVLVLALGTVTFHAIRAALSNPVDALRYE